MEKPVSQKAGDYFRQHKERIDRIREAEANLFGPSRVYDAAYARKLGLPVIDGHVGVITTQEEQALDTALHRLSEAHLFNAATVREAGVHYQENMDEYNRLAVEDYKKTPKAKERRLTFGHSTPEMQTLIHDPNYVTNDELDRWAYEADYSHPEVGKIYGDSRGALSAWSAIWKLFDAVGETKTDNESQTSVLQFSDGTEVELSRIMPRHHLHFSNKAVVDSYCINVHALARALEELEALPEKPSYFSSTGGRVGTGYLQAFTKHRMQSLEPISRISSSAIR